LSHARLVVSSSVHSAIGDVQIREGSFEWTRTGLLDDQAEAEIAVYIDENANDACDAGEPAWEHVSGPVTEDTVFTFSPLATTWEVVTGCETSRGTDLAMPAPCSP